MHSRRVLVIVAALGVAACGGGDDKTSSAADTTAVPEASTTTAVAETTAPSTDVAATDGPSDEACSTISAEEVSAIIGAPVVAADEGYRCKYEAGADYVTVELWDSSLQGSQDSFAYAADHGSLPPGIGDGAALLGLTIFVNVGDVQVVVDASNFGGAQTDQLTELARMVVDRVQ